MLCALLDWTELNYWCGYQRTESLWWAAPLMPQEYNQMHVCLCMRVHLCVAGACCKTQVNLSPLQNSFLLCMILGLGWHFRYHKYVNDGSTKWPSCAQILMRAQNSCTFDILTITGQPSQIMIVLIDWQWRFCISSLEHLIHVLWRHIVNFKLNESLSLSLC